MLLVYIKQELYMNVTDVESDYIATGLHGIMVRTCTLVGYNSHAHII